MKYILSGILLLCCVGSATAFKKVTNMVFVPAGEFLMGSSPEEVKSLKNKYGKRELYREYPFDSEAPKRKVYLKSFLIDRYEVTNLEYYRFVKATGHRKPKNWEGGRPKHDKMDHPALFVSQSDAMAYAQWAGKRLPTEEEWEKAARGSDGRVFPWGNTFDPYKSVTAESDLKFIFGVLCNDIKSGNKVGAASGDTSPYGVRDMAGNVREWTSTLSPGSSSMAVIKGGAWVDLSINARAAHREYAPKGGLSHIVGFRCVLDVEDGNSP